MRASSFDARTQTQEIISNLWAGADAFDNGDLSGGYYEADERNVAIFEKLHYDSSQKVWLAKFVPADPDRNDNPSPLRKGHLPLVAGE